ncbi:MAG: hypothetical protein Tsb002_21320 [Wenzhouxiangellaceae bacterium]
MTRLTGIMPTLLLSVMLFGHSSDVNADSGRWLESKSPMDASQAVQNPPVQSGGRATAYIRIDRGFRRAAVRVNYSNLVGEFTRIHLHCAPAGANGPIALGFVDLVALPFDNTESVTLGSKTIVGSLNNDQFPADSANQCGIFTLRDLADAIDAGEIYWNLHTTAFPPGELRGQVLPLE